ncbi:MAG TPA: serine/threonine-protein kinase, partial [Xanthomonadaceae bacterium]|nr:serine/threonine-protein kinase [Xanthomonadaceae bacterium]
MAIQDADWDLLDRLIGELLDLEPEPREQRLVALEADDPAVAARLRRMLAGLSRSAGLEALGESPLCAEALSGLSALAPGERLGDWTLLAPAGRGGMAEVFVAERTVGGARQQAAIKLMAQSFFGSLQRQRFQRETAILARLDDPRLARLIDAGTSPDGRPWLAMEYVDGEPLDRACDARGLTIAERVRLIIDVALAVDGAHRQLVVHRDLKPDNILLTQNRRIKLLDFGIARVLEDEQDAGATATQLRAYTLRYASPEQLLGAQAGIASDVYQLGLLLHLLLTGRRAFADRDGDPVLLLDAARRGPMLPSRSAAESDVETAA